MGDNKEESVCELLVRSRLLTAERLATLRETLPDDESVVEQLLRENRISRWQLDRVRSGSTHFFLGHGRYLLVDQIGQGGMGAVYRGRHLRLKRDVAIKVIDPNRVDDPELVSRFKREIEVCSRLQHEHIVHAYDVIEQGRLTFLVLEYVEGSDLSAIVKRDGPMPPAEAAAVCVQAASGLAYAHGQGVVHRDIKPSNILLSTAGTTKILDMGLARQVDAGVDTAHTGLTDAGAIMGTLDYMAPEQARDTHSADGRADLYSLGATLYFLLSGRAPFAGGSPIEKLHRLANEQPDALGMLRPDCPREITDAVEHMMVKDLGQRFQTAEDVVRSLQPLAADRIQGRPVVTAAVQTAAGTHRDTSWEPGSDDSPTFEIGQSSRSILSAIGRKPGAKTPRNPWLVGGAALAVIVPLVAVLLTQGGSESSDESAAPGVTSTEEPVEQKDRAPREVRVEFASHAGGIWSSAWSPDGTRLATGGGDGEVRIWEVDTQRQLTTLRGLDATVADVAYSSDGQRIVACDWVGNVMVWYALTGRELGAFRTYAESERGLSLSPPVAVDLRPNSTEVAIAFYTHSGAKAVRWDYESDQLLWTADEHLRTVEYSPGGKALLGTDGRGRVSVWDLSDGRVAFVHYDGAFPESKFEVQYGPGNDYVDPVPAAFVSDETIAFVTGNKVQIHNWAMDSLESTLPLPAERRAVWIDSSRCATLTSEGLQLQRFDGSEPLSRPFVLPDDVWHKSFSPNFSRCAWIPGQYASPNITVAFTHDPEKSFGIGSWDAPGELFSFGVLTPWISGRHHLSAIIGNAGWWHRPHTTWNLWTGEHFPDLWAPGHVREDGTIIVYDWKAERVAEWDASNSPLVAIGERPRDVEPYRLSSNDEDWKTGFEVPILYGGRMTGDGKMVWAPAPDLNSIRFWDAASGQVVKTIDFGEPGVYWAYNSLPSGPAMSRDGQTVAIVNGDGLGIRIWKGTALEPAIEIASALSNPIRFAMSPDGRTLAILTNYMVHIRNTDTGERTAEFHSELLPSIENQDVRFSASGRYLMITDRLWDLSADRPKRVWRCPERNRSRSRSTYAKAGAGTILPDEKHVVVRLNSQYQVWDWQANRKLITIFVLPGDEWAFVNHVTGNYLTTVTGESRLRFPLEDDEGTTQWLPPHEYAKRTGWNNDPTRVGLEHVVDVASDDSQ